MEYDERTPGRAQLAPILATAATATIATALTVSATQFGLAATSSLTVSAVGATGLITLWRRRHLDAADTPRRHLPLGRTAGEHRATGRTRRPVPASWRIPTPPPSVITLREHLSRRSPLALP